MNTKITKFINNKNYAIMKIKETTPIFVFDNCEVNYIIMYRDNLEENYHVKVFNYEWNKDCKEWYKTLASHDTFVTYKGAWICFKEMAEPYL